MTDEIVPYHSDEESVVIYRTDDNTLQLEVQVAEETVWLNQKQMAGLFNTTPQNITMHIGNIYKEQELSKEATCKDFLQVQMEGGKEKQRVTKCYNLDVIISVGYRVKSQRGIQFRQWANKVIKNFLLRGYAVNQQLLHLEERIDKRFYSIEQRVEKTEEKIDFFVRTSLPPVEQVFFEGEFFEARVILERIIKTAQKRVIIIDAYIDAATFEMLDVRAKGVTTDIYSDSLYKTLRDTHNASAGVQPINTHKWSTASHDRWLIVDERLYHCGHSVKDLGKRLSAIMLMGESPEAILNHVK
ncbi:MAG: virulence RhuM family protein [Paludibacteraceae bacterium]|nr:virulence RhuM family protein [Paludibacteraceae bacterium]